MEISNMEKNKKIEEEKIEETHIRVPVKFKEEIQEIIDYRAEKGLPKRKHSRIVKGIMNLDSWEKTKSRLKNAIFLDDKKGQTTIETFPLMVGLFILIVLLGVLHFGFNLVTTNLISATAGDSILSNAVSVTFGAINNASDLGMKVLTTALVLGLVFSMFFVAYFSKGKIWFLGLDFIITIFAYILAVPIRNQYEEFLTNTIFSAQLNSYTAATYFMLNLPRNIIIIAGIMIILSIIGNNLRAREEELIDIFE